MIGAMHVKITAYHPQSNGMVKRLHRTLKAALKCSTLPWVDALPSVLLGLRPTYKEDLKASPAEMVYGSSLRVLGEFFTTTTSKADCSTFVKGLRQLFKPLKAVPAAHHSPARPFVFKNFDKYSHVFKRDDKIKKPLEQPYTGPHRVINRNNSRTFTIEVDGEAKVVSTDQLKPAHLELAEPPCTAKDTLPHSVSSDPMDPPPVPSGNPKHPGRSVSFADSCC
ncbi:uncharacterized protein LOC106642604 [Copidosoma floridanum]|uniref:uncharacterized protein LOC106642604 n=1 Tax=Copidosoma floridanum TaxID=29053 RepID=UPI0006C9DBBA|nr:uncharacterized protein LOC106642604 [Copidosoma floridanum]